MKKHLDSRSLGVEMLEGMFTSRKLFFQLGAVIATGLTAWVWFGIFSAQTTESMLYVLDIKQGDSQLIVLTGENRGPPVKILIDGGKDRMVLNALDAALGNLNNKYLDIVIMTHTDLDHMGGLVEVARRYGVGLFISNGRDASSDAYAALKEVFVERNIPSIVLLEGDAVRYGDSILSILSPNQALLQNKEVNEASLVAILRSKDVNALFTGDIGFPAENALLKKYRDLSADILKVGHHGSKYSSSENFIAAVRPLVSVIGVGKNNYGHPAPHVLETLELAGSRVYRTDRDGTIRIPLTDEAPSASAKITADNAGLLATAARILTGGYKESEIMTVYVREAEAEKLEFALVPYKECSFRMGGTPKRSPVILNEVAWMGAESGATHEWIELRNVSGKNVNMAGWQLLNENERIRLTFPQKTEFAKQYMVLARDAGNAALKLNAELAFAGSIRNSNEGLRLFDNECNLIDEVLAFPNWPAGNNSTKQTMERTGNSSWANSASPGGTPRQENTGHSTVPYMEPRASNASPTPQTALPPTPCAAGKININMAPKEKLVEIRHIGNARADDIIANRPFASLAEFRGKVSGIGEARLADIIAEGKACAE